MPFHTLKKEDPIVEEIGHDTYDHLKALKVLHAHFGTDDLDGNVSGVSNETNTFKPVNTKHTFNIVYNIAKLPISGVAYNSTNGEITLLAGLWLLCASGDIGENPSNIQTVMNLCYGTKTRHSTEIEPGKRASVSGVVISDGSTVTTLQLLAKTKNNAAGQVITINKAHLHCVFLGVGETLT